VRRCLHAFLVGVLSVALSMDTARACWYLRHGHHAGAYRTSDCPAPAPCAVADDWQPCTAWQQPTEWVVVDAVVAEGCDGWACVSDVGMTDVAWMTEGSLDGCGCDGGVVADGIESAAVTDRSTAHVGAPVGESLDAPVATPIEPPVESVVMPKPVDGPDAPTVAAEEPPLEALQPAGLPGTDDIREDVQQATALTADESAAAESMPEEPTTEVPASTPVEDIEPAVESPAEPEEPNLFEEADAVATDAATTGAAPETDDVPPVEPSTDETREAEDAAPSGDTVPAGERATDDGEPAAPADPFDAATRSGEPVRRWIDRTGGYAAVGSLVAVRDDGTCVLATTDRLLTVPLAALSDHDRTYVVRAEGRLATRPPARDRDTAGL
jgi:hypothetical protein